MSDSDDQTLERELGKLGGIAGEGGRSSASFTARFLPTKTARESFPIPANTGDVYQQCLNVLSGTGEITANGVEASGSCYISAVVGSGFANMNPAILHIRAIPAGERDTNVQITASAKEGLIKQRTAEKAIQRFKEQLLRARSNKGPNGK